MGPRTPDLRPASAAPLGRPRAGRTPAVGGEYAASVCRSWGSTRPSRPDNRPAPRPVPPDSEMALRAPENDAARKALCTVPDDLRRQRVGVGRGPTSSRKPVAPCCVTCRILPPFARTRAAWRRVWGCSLRIPYPPPLCNDAGYKTAEPVCVASHRRAGCGHFVPAHRTFATPAVLGASSAKRRRRARVQFSQVPCSFSGLRASRVGSGIVLQTPQ